MGRRSSWSKVVCFGTFVAALVAVVGAQQPAPQAGAPARTGGAPAAAVPTGPLAPEKYKNIQILKDVAADQLEVTMRFVSAATGMQCVDCHVREADGQFSYDKDEKRTKATARDMMKLERAVNDQSFGGRVNVTCYTCHRGSNRPVSVPGLAEMFTADQLAAMNAPPRQGGAPAGAAGAPAQGAPAGGGGGRGGPPLPALDEVVSKYIDAAGGQPALEKLQGLVIAGRLTNRAGQTMAFSIEQKVPGRFLETIQSQPAAITRGFDGTAGWMQTAGVTTDLAGFALQQASRLADLGVALTLKTRFEGLRVVRGQTIGGVATMGLSGTSSPGVTDTLYLDAATGLPLRRTISTRTALGNLPEQLDYSDYGDVMGVKLPMTIKYTSWDTVDTFKVLEVKPTVQTPDSRFAKPK